MNAQTNAAEDGESTTRPPNPLLNLAQAAFQNVAQAAQNLINPTRTTTVKPSQDVKPVEVEKEKVEEVEPVVVADPVVQKEETPVTEKIVEEEKENIVKN